MPPRVGELWGVGEDSGDESPRPAPPTPFQAVNGCDSASGGGDDSSGASGPREPTQLPAPSLHPREGLQHGGPALRGASAPELPSVRDGVVVASQGAHRGCAHGGDDHSGGHGAKLTAHLPAPSVPVSKDFHNPRRVAAMLALHDEAHNDDGGAGGVAHLQALAAPTVGTTAVIEAALLEAKEQTFDEAEAVRVAKERVRQREAQRRCERVQQGLAQSRAPKRGCGSTEQNRTLCVRGSDQGGAAGDGAAVVLPSAPRGRDPTTVPKGARMYEDLVDIDAPSPVGVVRRVRKQVDRRWLARRKGAAPDVIADLPPCASRDEAEPKVRTRNLIRVLPFDPAVVASLCCDA